MEIETHKIKMKICTKKNKNVKITKDIYKKSDQFSLFLTAYGRILEKSRPRERKHKYLKTHSFISISFLSFSLFPDFSVPFCSSSLFLSSSSSSSHLYFISHYFYLSQTSFSFPSLELLLLPLFYFLFPPSPSLPSSPSSYIPHGFSFPATPTSSSRLYLHILKTEKGKSW